MPAVSPLDGVGLYIHVSLFMNFVHWLTKVHVIERKRQQKFNSSHSKEIEKQCIEVYIKFFISVLFLEIFSPKSTNCPPFWINF